MGGAGGEGLVPPLCGADPQDGSHDEDIGEGDEQKAGGEDGDADHRVASWTQVSAQASRDREDMAIEQADFLAAAKEQQKHEHSQLHGQDEPKHERPQGQSDAQLPAHREGEMQRVTDGHKPVTGHDGQQNAVSAAHEDKEYLPQPGGEMRVLSVDRTLARVRVADLQSCEVGQ